MGRQSQETQDCLDIVMLQDPEWVHIPLWVPHSSLTGFWLLGGAMVRKELWIHKASQGPGDEQALLLQLTTGHCEVISMLPGPQPQG